MSHFVGAFVMLACSLGKNTLGVTVITGFGGGIGYSVG